MKFYDKDGNEISKEDALAAFQSDIDAIVADKLKGYIPQARFKEVNDKKKTLADQLDEANTELETLRSSTEGKEGKFEGLYNKSRLELQRLKSVEENYVTLETSLQEYVDNQVSQLPEELRTLVPEGNAHAQFSWMSRNQKLLAKPSAFDIGAGLPGSGDDGGGDEGLSPEEKEIARRFGMTDAEYTAAKVSPAGKTPDLTARKSILED